MLELLQWLKESGFNVVMRCLMCACAPVHSATVCSGGLQSTYSHLLLCSFDDTLTGPSSCSIFTALTSLGMIVCLSLVENLMNFNLVKVMRNPISG